MCDKAILENGGTFHTATKIKKCVTKLLKIILLY